MRALVVDDDPGIRTLFSTALELEGWDVDVAENGEVGLEKALGAPPDVILLDLMMPGISGHTVLEELLRQPAVEHIPRVVISAKDTAFDKDLAFAFGADEYLVKPVEPSQVVAVASRLARSPHRAPASRSRLASVLGRFGRRPS